MDFWTGVVLSVDLSRVGVSSGIDSGERPQHKCLRVSSSVNKPCRTCVADGWPVESGEETAGSVILSDLWYLNDLADALGSSVLEANQEELKEGTTF